MQDLRNNWTETFWSMAEGSKQQYDALKKTDTMEFWKIFDLWTEKVERETQRLKDLKNSQRNGR